LREVVSVRDRLALALRIADPTSKNGIADIE
jgi:hypothetical protein